MHFNNSFIFRFTGNNAEILDQFRIISEIQPAGMKLKLEGFNFKEINMLYKILYQVCNDAIIV